MSSITQYFTEAFDNKGNVVNIRDALIEKGALTMNGEKDGYQCGTLDYSIISPETWAKDSAVMKKQLGKEPESKYEVMFDKGGNQMSYSRDTISDELPIAYASKAVPDAVFKGTTVHESNPAPTAYFYVKDDSRVTPSGKQYGGSLNVNDKAIIEQEGSNQVKVMLRLGDDERRALVYANKSDVVESVYDNRKDVFFEKDKEITVYNLGDKENPKTKMSVEDLMDEHETAKQAYHDRVSPKQMYFSDLEADGVSKDASDKNKDDNDKGDSDFGE